MSWLQNPVQRETPRNLNRLRMLRASSWFPDTATSLPSFKDFTRKKKKETNKGRPPCHLFFFNLLHTLDPSVAVPLFSPRTTTEKKGDSLSTFPGPFDLRGKNAIYLFTVYLAFSRRNEYENKILLVVVVPIVKEEGLLHHTEKIFSD